MSGRAARPEPRDGESSRTYAADATLDAAAAC